MINKLLKNFTTIIFILSFALSPSFIIRAQEIPELSAGVIEMVPEKDLVEVFCLMTKYKTGEFFAALEGLNEVLIPALNNLKIMGIDVSAPDISGYLAQGQVKLDAVCSASDYESAKLAAKDFINFGEMVKQELSGLNSSLGPKLKTKGDEMRTKVENQLNALVEQEKIKIEQELKSEADKLASQMRANLEREMTTKDFTSEAQANAYANSRASQIKASIESQMNSLAEQKKKELEKKVNSKASEILGVDVEKFKAVGEKMANIEAEINQTIASKKQNYEQYRLQAMAKRKDLILTVVNKNIEEAINQIKEKEDLLKEAKINDPSVKTADEYINELNQDKEILAEKIQAAIGKGDEAAINSAAEEMQNKWDGLRQSLEKDLAKRQKAKDVCEQAMPQLELAKPKMESGLAEIEKAQNEIGEKSKDCDTYQDPLCLKVESILNQLLSSKEKLQLLINKINSAEKKCVQVTDETPIGEVADDLLLIKNSGLDLQEEMSLLKENWLKDKTDIEKALVNIENYKKQK